MTRYSEFANQNLKFNLEELEPRQMLSSVDIFAAGVTNQETIQLKIDDAVVQTFYNVGGDAYAGQFQTLSYYSDQEFTADQIKIEFVNDFFEGGVDRNVRIDKIAVDGIEFETEASNVFSTGTWRPEDGITSGFRQSEYLHSNGYFKFSGSGNGGSVIDVIARGSTGEENFILEVAGQEVANWYAGTTNQQFSISTGQPVEADQVRIYFVNDLYSPDKDRNLIVDKIIIDGQTIETESDSVFSTGTWSSEDGLQPGFRNSEYLHSNGYFQYATDRGSDLFARTEFGVQNDIEELQDPSRGFTFRRITEASYPGDGSGVQWDAPRPSTNPQAPPNFPGNVGTAVQPKEITSKIYAPGSDVNRPNSAGLNEYSVFFSQFVTHDLVHSVRAAGPPIFYDGQFIPVSRTPAVVENGVLQQVSSDTPTLDLGLVYGRDEASTDLLRQYVLVDGQWTAGAKLIAGGAGDVLPSYAEVAAQRAKSVEEVRSTLGATFLNLPQEALDNQFATGDERANQTTSLAAHHAIWHRNHNWHVEKLRAEHPGMSEEQLYQAARALNEAEYQKVIYDEYLPKLLGQNAISDYTGFDSNVDTSIINEWTTVGFRFGHDQTSEGQLVITESGEVSFVPLEVSSLLANTAQGVRTDEQLGDFVRGQLSQSSQEIDGRIGNSLRNALFGVPANQDGNDGSETEFLQLNLPLLDIHRGRDHGVSDYNQLRAGLGLSTYNSLDEFAHDNGLSYERLAQLKSVYSDISELDAIVGGLLEAKIPGSQLGATMHTLTVMQFEATRDGDEFFYLNRFKDSPETLDQVANTSMNDILIRNSVVDNGYTDAFQAHSRIEGDDNSDDFLWGTEYADLILGRGGNDHLYGGEGDDTVFGNAGNDVIHGQGQNDYLFGGWGHDTLSGGWGNDIVDGGAGYDVLYGNQGNDIFVFSAGNDTDVVKDFSYGDKIDLSSFGFNSFHEVETAISYNWHSAEIQLGSDKLVLKWVTDISKYDVII